MLFGASRKTSNFCVTAQIRIASGIIYIQQLCRASQMLHAWEGKSEASFRQVLPRTSAMMTPKAKQGHKLNMHAKNIARLQKSPSLNQTHPVHKQTPDTRQIYNATRQKINNPVSLKQIIKVNFKKGTATKQRDNVSWLSLVVNPTTACPETHRPFLAFFQTFLSFDET